MMILLTYDVDMTDIEGAKRLRKVAKICEDYGLRVQNSVFELLVDPAQLVEIKNKISKVINSKKDSVRFYRLGNNWQGRIETMGIQTRVKQGDTIVL